MVAVSRDLKRKYKFGTKVRITGIGKHNGVYVVRDVMNKRFTKRVDILINGKDKELLLNGLNKYKKKHKGDLVHIEEIRNNHDAGMYITKHFNINTLTKSDIVWDIILN